MLSGESNVNEKDVSLLSQSTEELWSATKVMDKERFGKAMTLAFEAQTRIFPSMLNTEIMEQIESIKERCLGYKMSGAGGGGYLVVFTDQTLKNTLKLRIRRS